MIEANESTVTAAAKLLGVTRVKLSNVLNQKSDISPDMAYGISKVFGGTADLWANLQTKYNTQLAEEPMKDVKLMPYQPRKTV